jgi:RNA 3'-terminal phosphate cyclase (RTC)-like protein
VAATLLHGSHGAPSPRGERDENAPEPPIAVHQGSAEVVQVGPSDPGVPDGLPGAALARGRSTVAVEGGTHNPMAPPFDFLARVFLPLVGRMGPRSEAVLERPGFYPAGGGRFHVTVEPARTFEALVLTERAEIRARRAPAVFALFALDRGA